MKRILMMAAILAIVCAKAFATTPGANVNSTVFFGYDKLQPLNAEMQQVEKNARATIYHVSYATTNAQRVTAYLYVPATGKAPYPCVIMMHGAGGSKEDFKPMYDFLSMRGYAVLAPDAAFHGERISEGIDSEAADWYQTRNLIMQTVVDLRRTIDWLETRPEVDSSRIGYLAASQGSFIGSIFVAVDTRVKAAALLVGGADFKVFFRNSQLPSINLLRNYLSPAELDAVADELAPIDPQYYIGSISPRPLLLMNGRKDLIISEAAGKRLQELAGEPKETYWYDGTHIPPFDLALVRCSDFFRKYLKPSKKNAPQPAADEKKNAAAAPKPEISVKFDRNMSDPAKRLILISASTKKPLPQGASLAVQFPNISPGNFPLKDDGSHGDAKAGDGVWSFRFELGPVVPDLAVVGGPKLYKTFVVAVSDRGEILSSVDVGALTGEVIPEEKP